MELDRALELVVASSWGDLVKPGEVCSVRIEYNNVSNTPLNSVEVWASKNRGYGTLVCRYCITSTGGTSSRHPGDARASFANSYRSKTLAEGLDFVMRNQGRFTRSPASSVHGLIRMDSPGEDGRSDASLWKQLVLAEFDETVWN